MPDLAWHNLLVTEAAHLSVRNSQLLCRQDNQDLTIPREDIASYSRLCNGLDNVDKHLKRLEMELPPEGSIRTLVLTDKQFSRMRLWVGGPTVHEKKVNAQQLILL